MKYCKVCLSTNLRPGGLFINGVCSACFYYKDIDNQNFNVKLKKFRELYKKSLSNSKMRDFDCIVGVSGGKDSTRQAHWVRDRLGLKPLIVAVTYPPKQMSQVGADNLSNFISMGFDMITVTPSPRSSAQLSLEGFKLFGNVSKSSEKALFSTVPRLAIELGIKTIFWGENNALQVGEKTVLGTSEFDANNLRKMNTLSEGGEKWIFDLVGDKKALHYIYPDEMQFLKKKINIFYLGPVWDDWSTTNNSTYASLNGLTLRPGEEYITGDISNASMLDEQFTNINMMIKYYKFGFGRATDYVNDLIRLGQISRKQAIAIVEEFDGVCHDSIIDSYCKYVGITIMEFWQIVYSYTNKNLFEIRKGSVRPIRKFKIC